MKRARTEQAKDERRQLLLDAALDEFYERGFAAARMDDIAQRAGLSKGTLYLYFKSKEDLFNGLVETISLPKLEQVRAMLSMQDSLEGALNALAAFAPVMIKQSRLPHLMKVIIGESNLFPKTVRRYREEVIDQAINVMTMMLEAARQRGEIEVENPRLMARLVVAPIVFSAIWEVSFGRDPEAEVDLPALFQLHVKILKDALLTRSNA